MTFVTECKCIFQVAVGHPSEIDEIFDAISYSKGSSVIRMLHDYLGDEVSLWNLQILLYILMEITTSLRQYLKYLYLIRYRM